MKKFFALLFVCAGLSAMAITPRVIHNVKVDQDKAKSAMVLKSTKLSNQLSTPAMQMAAGKSTTSIQKFFKDNNLTPSDNKMLKKAPRRVTEDAVLGDKIAFMEQYEPTADSIVESNIFYYGGWDASLEKVDENVLQTYLFFTGIPFTINVDYEAKTAEMVMEYLFTDQSADTTVSGRTRTITNTTSYVFLWDEAYVTDENAEEPANLQGTIYEDGSIYFPDGWTLYSIDCVNTKVYRNNSLQSETNDTTASLWCGFMRDTYLMTPSGKHTFEDPLYQGTEPMFGIGEEANVYMYQFDDTTAVVWNLWGIGNRYNYMFIYEDGSMVFPSMQYGGDMFSLREMLEENYGTTDYDWTDADHVTLMAYDESTGKPVYGEDMYGTVTANEIAWPYTMFTWWGQNVSSGGWTYVSFTGYPISNNKLTFTNEDFFMLGYTTTPVITYEVNDDNVVITAAPGDDEEATVLLGIYDEETEMVTWVENPYTVERTDADQVIIFASLAQAYGKNVSEWAVAEITIPALEISFLRGDVNMDGSVGIADITDLIDFVLNGDPTGIDQNAADCDQDGSIGITDVTALIDFVLNGEW